MSFPLGKPILLMIIAAAVTGAMVLTRPAAPRADCVVWVFAESHARSFRGDSRSTHPSLVELYQQQTGQSVDVKLIGAQALNVRLNAIFDRDKQIGDVPDLVEVEINAIGRYFRAPTREIGFLPLNDRLRRDGLLDRLVAARLATWTKDGVIFGVPLDVHPVSLTYRRDLFEEAGIDLTTATTWPAFQEKCLAYQAYWSQHGHADWRAMELPHAAVDTLEAMLLQRHINLLGEGNASGFTEPRTLGTIAFYARAAAGPRAIGGDPTPSPETGFEEISTGQIGAMLMPDWRSSALVIARPQLAGKLAMMPLPRFDPADADTATRGGTMIAIPRAARDPERAWQLLKFLHFSPEGMAARQQYTATLPPLKDAWADPIWHRADPFFGGQKIGELYIRLAQDLPQRTVTPYTSVAQQAMAMVMSRAIRAVEHGDADLESQIAGWLKEADAEVRKRIDFGRFDE